MGADRPTKPEGALGGDGRLPQEGGGEIWRFVIFVALLKVFVCFSWFTICLFFKLRLGDGLQLSSTFFELANLSPKVVLSSSFFRWKNFKKHTKDHESF